MTQKEQKNQIKNLLACAERLLCCMTEVQQDMDEAAKSIKQQKLLSDEIASKLENKLKELREETKNYTDICGETGIKKSYGIFYVRGKACFNRTAAAD